MELLKRPMLRPALNLLVALGGKLPERYRQWWYYKPGILKRIAQYVPRAYEGEVVVAGRSRWLSDCSSIWREFFVGKKVFADLTLADSHFQVVDLPAAQAWLEPLLEWCGESAHSQHQRRACATNQ
jgi:hypothetical protein